MMESRSIRAASVTSGQAVPPLGRRGSGGARTHGPGRRASRRHRDPPRQERHGHHQEEEQSMDYIDADWRPVGDGRNRRRRTGILAAQRRAWHKMTRAERRRARLALRDCAMFLGCIIVAIGLPGWVEYLL